MKAYQLEGLNWMIHLAEKGLNGILADVSTEMMNWNTSENSVTLCSLDIFIVGNGVR
jgi:hypothetical protein